MASDLDLSLTSGLSSSEAQARLARDGPNRLPDAGARSPWRLVAELMREPMLLLLAACVTVYAALGDLHEAGLLAIMVVMVIALSLVQGWRTEQALARLRQLAEPRARVIRDHQLQSIASTEVVRGDWIVLAEGERVPADAVLRAGSNLRVDESLLTGESVAVDKIAVATGEPAAAPGGAASAALWSGSLVVAGTGLAEVQETGAASAIGRIGAALQRLEPASGPSEIEARRLVRLIGTAALVVCALVFAWLLKTRGDWVAALLAALALAMSLVPEEIPVVMTIFVAMGAWRLSRLHVLARRLGAVEALGALTVVALDKTGTLTANRMEVVRLAAPAGDWVRGEALREELHTLLEYAVLASHRDSIDPMESAIATQARDGLAGSVHWHADWKHLHEYPLTPELLAVSHAWSAGEGVTAVAAKGAPEAICELCHLAPEQTRAVLDEARALARQGLRVLGVAAGQPPAALPERAHDLEFEFLGLIGLADPLRPEAAATVSQLRAAGMRILMITGDYPATALAIARQAGLARTVDCLTGAEIDALSPAALGERVKEVDVYARVSPSHKLAIVEALQARGEIVAMTGDGVNDAPALRAANVGVAMGRRGAEVAREAAALVLLEDKVSALPGAVALGRRVSTNLRQAMRYLIAVHLMIAGVALLPIVAGGPLILLPAQIALLQLLIDPACSIAFEAEAAAPGQMTEPPRPPTESLIAAWPLALWAGGCAWAAIAAVAAFTNAQDASAEIVRTAAFVTMLGANLLLVLWARSATRRTLAFWPGPPLALLVVLGAGLGLILASLAWAGFAGALGLAPLPRPAWMSCALALLALAVVLEASARFRRSRGS